jgi:NADH:ubiquinone reductase (H+-translocating)
MLEKQVDCRQNGFQPEQVFSLGWLHVQINPQNSGLAAESFQNFRVDIINRHKVIILAMKRIVILGGGFGGLQAALTLSKELKKLPIKNNGYEVILIDKNNYHTFTPLLYEVATTSKETADYLELKSLVAYPFRELLRNKNVRFVKDEVLHIDIEEGAVHLKGRSASRRLKFDYLVLALGSEVNHFDISGLKEKSFSLNSFIDSLKIRDAILEAVEGGKERPKIVIGGAGATGVELAGEIIEWTCKMNEEIGKACNAEVALIDGAATILSPFGPKVIKSATKRLKKLGVKLINNEYIKRVKESELTLASGKKISFDILIWTGGVRAASLTEKLPLKTEPRGRVEIFGPLECVPESPDLKVTGKIYVIGDIACFYDPVTKKPVPQVARPAIIQGRVAAKNIIEDIKKEKRLAKKVKRHLFTPWNYPYIIPIGGKYAIAKFGPVVITGFPAWVIKGLVELNYFLSIMPFFTAMRVWTRGLWIFIQNDRLG